VSTPLHRPPGTLPPQGAPLAGALVWRLVQLAWEAVRLPAFVLLRLAEPVVRLGLTAVGLLSFLIALFYRMAAAPSHNPFWPLLGFALLCGLLLLLYERLLRFLS
jgi:hypothetical protein